MCRTGMCRFGIKNWIFLFVSLHLFTYAQGGEELDPGIRFTVEPSDLVVGAGEAALLPCAAITRHAMRMGWRHNVGAMPTRDHALTHDDKYRKQLPNGSLVISSMTSSLAGQYQCVASVDGVGSIVSRVATVFLAEVPELVGGVRSVLAGAGGGALLSCGVRAPPRVALLVHNAPQPERRVYGAARAHHAPPTLALNVTWLKNGSPVRLESARVSVTPSGALEIDPLRAHDAATYRCRVALWHAHTLYKEGEEVEVRVSAEEASVESPPRFIATPQPVTIMEGASVTFDCAATGNPKPEITWLNNGVAIDLSDLDSRFYLVGSGSLRVQSARALDAGAYTCRAHSRLDSTDHTTQLHVQTPPRVSVPRPVVVAAARGDVTLPCSVRGRPAPTPAWYKDGELLSPNNDELAIVDGCSLRIQGVLALDAGMFQCVATSPAGAAVAATRLLVTHTHQVAPPNSTRDILTSLITVESTLDPSTDDSNFLGETSSAFTPIPELEYDEIHDEFASYDDFHAAEVEGAVNASLISMPRELRAVIVKHRFVTLSWEPPEVGADDVTGYAVIYRVKGSERERVVVSEGQRHELNVASLQPNTTYQLCVQARGEVRGEHTASPRTEVIEVTTPAEEVSHGPPVSVEGEAAGPHALRVTWGPPATPPRPTQYTLHYTEVESGREQFQLVDVDPSLSQLSHTLGALRAATAYTVSVCAGGAGGPCAGASLSTPTAPPTMPPSNVTAVSAGPTSILVRWEAPPSRSHGGPLTGYKVRYRAAGGGAAGGRRKADSLTTPANTRRAELRDLDTAATYQIRVSAINAAGSGPFSEWVLAATRALQLDETRVPPAPPPLTTRAGRDWISVWWSEEGAGGGVVVRGWLLGWGEGVPDDQSRQLAHTTHSYVIKNLEPNAEYVISLRASNAAGLGPAVYGTVRTRADSEGDELGEPGDLGDPGGDGGDDEEEEGGPAPLIPPVGLKVIMLSGTTAVVYWTDPTLPKGQPATDGRRYVVRWWQAGGAGGRARHFNATDLNCMLDELRPHTTYPATDGRRYVVRWWQAGGAGGRARYFNATDLNCMLDELRPHTTYEFSVKLIKGGRESAWSMLVSNTTLEAAPASPPRELRVTAGTPPARAADLTWLPPAKPNGLITGYVIMYAVARTGAAAGTEEWTAVTAAGERARARVDRLRARTTYLFRVQARNARGLGPPTAPVQHTTDREAGEGGGLASATSAWLWASAGGACAVLALAAALALSLCCRRNNPPLSPDTSTYQKSSASAALKPPDLWIHHDQMELKHMDKGLHASASKISASSVEGGLVSSTLTLGRTPPAPPAEYEPARHPPAPPPPASLDRRHYVPTYVESRRSPSVAGSGSDETAVLRASPASLPCSRCEYISYKPMTGMGVGVGVGVGCAATCDRRHRMPHPDQSTPLLAGMGPLSPQSSLASLHPPHPAPPPAPCGSGTCPLGAACGAGGAGGPAGQGGGDIYACAARERGHYVAYEPLGHYTHRDSVSSEVGAAGAAGAGGSLQRRVQCTAPLHSFTLSDNVSDHSTPTHSHSRGSLRDTSPYKKSASSSPGHVPNRLQLGGVPPHCAEEVEPLTPSRSTERLHREMQNLEGLMKDLSAITQHQFHC